jgi:hypothetical protein
VRSLGGRGSGCNARAYEKEMENEMRWRYRDCIQPHGLNPRGVLGAAAQTLSLPKQPSQHVYYGRPRTSTTSGASTSGHQPLCILTLGSLSNIISTRLEFTENLRIIPIIIVLPAIRLASNQRSPHTCQDPLCPSRGHDLDPWDQSRRAYLTRPASTENGHPEL